MSKMERGKALRLKQTDLFREAAHELRRTCHTQPSTQKSLDWNSLQSNPNSTANLLVHFSHLKQEDLFREAANVSRVSPRVKRAHEDVDGERRRDAAEEDHPG